MYGEREELRAPPSPSHPGYAPRGGRNPLELRVLKDLCSNPPTAEDAKVMYSGEDGDIQYANCINQKGKDQFN